MLYLGANGLVTNSQCAPIQCDTCPDDECGGENCFTFDCPGGTDECPWDPPEGECGDCASGTTPSSILVSFGGLDLSSQLAGGQLTYWTNYFQSTTFELAQRAGTPCSYRLIDETPAAEPFQTTSFESVVFVLSLSDFPNGWQLGVTGSGTAGGGGGPSITLWGIYPSTDNAGTLAQYANGDDCDSPGVGQTQYYSRPNASGYVFGDIGPFTLTMMPYGGYTADHA